MAPLFGSAEYAVKICHYSMDKVAMFEDMTRRYANNTNLSMLPSQEQWRVAETAKGITFSHGSTAFTCALYAALDIIEMLSL